MEIVIYITISILILAIALIKQRMLANIETSNPYHAQYILRRRDDYLVLFDRDALSSRFFYDAITDKPGKWNINYRIIYC
ncbi:hypothetical protein KEP54_17165 [Escherichia coli]|nr:hypothetical protein [Escherichia coli]